MLTCCFLHDTHRLTWHAQLTVVSIRYFPCKPAARVFVIYPQLSFELYIGSDQAEDQQGTHATLGSDVARVTDARLASAELRRIQRARAAGPNHVPATRKKKLIKPACQLHFLPKHVAGPDVCDDPMSPSYRRHTLGCMDKIYRYCGALKWLDERVSCDLYFRTFFINVHVLLLLLNFLLKLLCCCC